MPAYSNSFPPYAIAQGEQAYLVGSPAGGEQLGTNNFSQRVAIQDKDGSLPRPVLLSFNYASAPAAVRYDIYVAWDDTAPTISYTKVGSTTATAGEQVSLQRGAAGGYQFRFICVQEVTSPGVNATVKVQQ